MNENWVEGFIRESESENKKRESEANSLLENNPTRAIDGLRIYKNNRSYIVQVPVPQGHATIEYTEILRSRQSFETVINIQFHHATEGKYPAFEQRIDLNSASAIGNLVTSLNSSYGNKQKGYNWTLVLNRANTAIKKAVLEEKKSTNVLGKEYSEEEFLFFPFLQKDASNMIFGDGEAGKTYFCLSMVAHTLSKQSFFGYTAPPIRALLIDYETNERSFANRLHRIANGMGVEFSLLASNIEHYKPESSIKDETEVIAKIVEEKGFDLIIIDAGADASGSPNDEDKVLMMFNSLNNIPCTKLIIHHEPKDSQGKDADKAYYGTTYWRNRVRQSYRLTIEEKENKYKTLVRAINTKSNDAAREEAFIYSVEYSEKGALVPSVKFELVDEFQPSENQRIVSYLIEAKKAPTNEIADATGLTRTTVQRRLQELLGKEKIDREKDSLDSRRVLWKLFDT